MRGTEFAENTILLPKDKGLARFDGADVGLFTVEPGSTLKLENLTLQDDFGRVRLSDTARQDPEELREAVPRRDGGIAITIVDKNIGYELRAAPPIPFDEEYTRNLGYGAVRYLLKGGSGAMIVFDEGRLRPIPFVEMIDEATGKIKVRMVDTTSENYVVGRIYMIRIEKEDLSGERLDRLARAAHMPREAFLERFSRIC